MKRLILAVTLLTAMVTSCQPEIIEGNEVHDTANGDNENISDGEER